MLSESEFACRRAVWKDIAEIQKLIKQNPHAVSNLIRRFGEFSLPYVLSTSVRVFVVEDRNSAVVGFASFLDSPPSGHAFGVLAEDRWPAWFQETFTAPNYGSHNTLWLSLFISAPGYESDVSEQVLNTLFEHSSTTEGVLALLPMDTPVDDHITAMFEELPIGVTDYYGPRCYICPKLLCTYHDA